MEQSDVRGALGMFLFTGDDVFQPIKTLSGGEKGRVALTALMLRKDNLLLLDEPTNHLDMDSREVLEDALENFPGTILAISHDRYFINRFADKVCVLEKDGVKEYLGNYDDYFEKINREQAPDSEYAGMTRTAMEKEKRKSREEEKRIKERKIALQNAEKAIAKAEDEAADIEMQLADPATYADPDKAAALAKAYQAKKDEIDRLYAEWEAMETEE
jgi:ATP-binding cassette subfamily F protein 3